MKASEAYPILFDLLHQCKNVQQVYGEDMKDPAFDLFHEAVKQGNNLLGELNVEMHNEPDDS